MFQPLGPGDCRPTVPGLHLEVFSFPPGMTLASAERGILASKWNGWDPIETKSAYDTSLWWGTREDAIAAIVTEKQTGGIVARWSGRLNTDTSGRHSFSLRSGDGSRLYVNGLLVVNNDGHHSMVDASGTIQLTSGWQTIVLVYYSSVQHGAGGLQVSVQKPGSSSFEKLNMTQTRPIMLAPTQAIGQIDVCGCGTNLDTIFAVPKGMESILTAAAFHSICQWEETLMQDEMLAFPSHCEISSSGSCCMPQSLPRMLSSALRIPCHALTDAHISNTLHMLKLGSLSLGGGVNLDTVADGFINEEWLGAEDVSLATRSRSLLCLDSDTYPRIGNHKAGSGEALGASILIPYDDHLGKIAGDTNDDELSRFVFNLHLCE